MKRSRDRNDYDVVVLGRTVSGAACAAHLAREGLRVLVLGKQNDVSQSDFIAGEAVEMLVALGVDLNALGAKTIENLVVSGPSRSCESRLSLFAAGLSQAAVLNALVAKAEQAGAVFDSQDAEFGWRLDDDELSAKSLGEGAILITLADSKRSEHARSRRLRLGWFADFSTCSAVAMARA
jgi:2-polyprenyl-6-methoxyphenol hydroxylase-like FAD-dependent oxidoreductase